MIPSSARQALARHARPVREAAARLAHPLVEALVTGAADPAGRLRSRRLRPRMPRALGLLPFRTIDLVLLADLALTFILFKACLSMLQEVAVRVNSPLDPDWLMLTALAFSLPLALRSRWPLAAWRAAAVLIPLGTVVSRQLIDPPYNMNTAIMYALVVYAVAVRSERHITVGVWLVSVLVAWMIYPGSLTVVTGIVTATVLFGHNVRARRLAIGLLAQEEQRSRQALAGQAVLEERARIARELHDVVAHHMSVIAIQAEAVPLRAAGDAERLEEGLREIRALSLAAMTEMRRVLGVLREDDGHADIAPQPGLGRLEELVDTARSAGLTVTLKVGGDLTGLPTAVSLSAYRIAQESLSNAMRHAPGSAVSMRIARYGAELHVQVTNDAGHRSPGEPRRMGHGLIGMRERVSMLGGSLWAGPVGAGFAVTAILPITGNA
ncbi:histidine kinase [Streptosporangium sp. NPDC001681]|uniref:sensor histidine kinase n=1 Tax=Streptosporangium sp. NPDC001681 TaxID=3154395 RepID=UPI0033229E05